MAERDVLGFEGVYVVSDQGVVRSLPRPGTRGGVLAQSLNGGGHPSVSLSGGGKLVKAKVHTLVLEAFVGPRPDGMEARHLNGIPTDNRAVNLQWGTRSENVLDRVAHGTHHETKKTHCSKGHPFDEANTYPYRGKRVCKKCRGWA